MTALLLTTPATVTVYAVAHALAAGPYQRAVLIERPAADRHTEQARTAEDRRTR